MIKKYIVFLLFILAVTVFSGCSTIKGAGSGVAYTIQGMCDDTVGLLGAATGLKKWEGSQTVKGVKNGFNYTENGIRSDFDMSWVKLDKVDKYISDNLW
jgi:predicted small secreted protein